MVFAMSLLRYFGGALLTALQVAVACAAGLLPRRHWPDLDRRLPVTRAAALSALATFGVAALIGIPGFFRYVETRTDLIVENLLVSTGWLTPTGAGNHLSTEGAQMVWVSEYLAPFTYALLTPTGLLAFYLTITGYFRFAAWYVEAPQGDPLLTFVDSFVHRRRQAAAAQRAKEAREALEGPEVPDRLVTGHAAGLPGAELVVVSSRRKPGWDAGVFVITPDTWYRLGTPVERMLPGGLRTLYPLNELRDLEVRRKSVEYVLPPLSGAAPSERNRA